MTQPTPVIWFTGISGSGKTTLAKRLMPYLQENYHVPLELLDGDEVRDFFEGDLGFDRREKMLNVRRIAFGACLLAKNGIMPIVCNMSPYHEVRDFVRRKMAELKYCQIYIKRDVALCQENDVKGLYKKAENGELTDMVGLDDAYQEPRSPDLVIDTGELSIDQSFDHLIDFLKPVLSKYAV